jgi:hypothetical protein
VVFTLWLVITAVTCGTLTLTATGAVAALITLTWWAVSAFFTAWRAVSTGLLLTWGIMRCALVGVQSGGVFFVLLTRCGRRLDAFFLFAENSLQAGFEAAEKGFFLRRMFGTAWGGHKCVGRGMAAHISQFIRECKPTKTCLHGLRLPRMR